MPGSIHQSLSKEALLVGLDVYGYISSHSATYEEQEETLEALKKQLSWFEKVKYVPGEERETKNNILHKEMTMLRGN